MADPKRGGLSSAFDDLLSQNKRRFDDLDVSRRLGPGVGSGSKPLAADARDRGAAAVASAARNELDSPAIRRLNERFGPDWHYEIAEQKRSGDEAIVLCRLHFGKHGFVRTQFGRAKLVAAVTNGSAGDVRFSLQSTEDGEREAFRRATEAALMNCIALI